MGFIGDNVTARLCHLEKQSRACALNFTPQISISQFGSRFANYQIKSNVMPNSVLCLKVCCDNLDRDILGDFHEVDNDTVVDIIWSNLVRVG